MVGNQFLGEFFRGGGHGWIGGFGFGGDDAHVTTMWFMRGIRGLHGRVCDGCQCLMRGKLFDDKEEEEEWWGCGC
jgi:hypothetical protein